MVQKQARKQTDTLKVWMCKSNFLWLENLQGKFLCYRPSLELSSVSAVLQGSHCPFPALSMQLSPLFFFLLLSFLSPALPRGYHTIVFSCSYLQGRSVTPNQACAYEWCPCIHFLLNTSKYWRKIESSLYCLVLDEMLPVLVNLGVEFSTQSWLECCSDSSPEVAFSWLSPILFFLQNFYYFLQFGFL